MLGRPRGVLFFAGDCRTPMISTSLLLLLLLPPPLLITPTLLPPLLLALLRLRLVLVLVPAPPLLLPAATLRRFFGRRDRLRAALLPLCLPFPALCFIPPRGAATHLGRAVCFLRWLAVRPGDVAPPLPSRRPRPFFLIPLFLVLLLWMPRLSVLL